MPNLGTCEYVLYKIALLQNNFGVFLCVIVYRHFVLNFWWHSHHEYQLVAKSTVLCFFKLVLFSQCRFSTVVCPRCAPELGAQRKFGGGGTLKKFLCSQIQNRVGAYGSTCNSRKVKRSRVL